MDNQDTATTERLCSGYGQWHSPNNKKNPADYIKIEPATIEEMLESPPRTKKQDAQWVIFSSLLSRVHADQRKKGEFHCLWADIDDVNDMTFDIIVEHATGILPEFWAYTSSSATEDKQKTRIIVPLAMPVSGERFVLLQRALNNQIEAVGITPDRATERAGQVCYLPNKGKYYQYHKNNNGGRLDPGAWADLVEEEQERIKAAERAAEQRRELAKAKAATRRMQTGCKSPIDAYNAEFSVELELEARGYVRKGRRWISPNSESGNPGVIILDGKWFSAHGSDNSIGKRTENGTMGDAFDLFTYYDHHADLNAAIKSASEMFGLNNDWTPPPHEGWPDFESQESPPGDPPSDAHAISDKDIISAAYDDQKGCAQLFIQLNNDLFCYDHASRRWYRFRKHYWIPEDIGQPVKAVDEVQDLFSRTAANLSGEIIQIGQRMKNTTDPIEQEKLKQKESRHKAAQKQLNATAKKLNSLDFRKKVVEFAAQGYGTLGVTGTEWDKKPWDLACANGIVYLKSGKLKTGRPADYIKSPCPTIYDPKAVCPRFKDFLIEIFADDQDLIEFAQRVFGMGLIGNSFLKQYLIILSGQGRNGKDTLINAIGHVLGATLAGPIAPEMLLDSGKFGQRSSSGPTPDIMRLRGLRLAWASETTQGRKFDAGRAKMFTGGGSLVGRDPYGKYQVEFEQSHLIFLLTNHRPHAPVDDYAFWKRICNIPFEQSFVDDPQAKNEHKADKHLQDKLKKEAPGVLAWLVQGCLGYQRDGLNPPQVVTQANEDYRRSEDTLQDFFEEQCVVGRLEEVKANSLYREYKAWATNGGIKPMTTNSFGRQLTIRGFIRKKSSGLVRYEGIGLVHNQHWNEDS